MGAPKFSKSKTLIQDPVCVNNISLPKTIKINNGAVAISKKMCDANGTNNSINLKKYNMGK